MSPFDGVPGPDAAWGWFVEHLPLRGANQAERRTEMTADLQLKAYGTESVLYMALELSNEKWRLAFGDGTCGRQVSIAAGGIAALSKQIGKVEVKWDLCEDVPGRAARKGSAVKPKLYEPFRVEAGGERG